ncbi:Type 1 glutamine amidotransferase-like domain-containing protein [Paenibacillus alvei]|uniref:Type 1 glutamine amidotransferase-like domain-containing protein n=1 Tax=Paenibacillus alvei TaxID=44250 RepID=UPI0022823082|nr:Type 1 glutamine amidotransferase-like domain-containing protein [Paenibacillus alvei]
MKQIIAMGGGGFSMEPKNPLLDLYILQQASSENPKVCFVPTASGDADGYIQRFYKAFGEHTCDPSHLSLFNPPTTDLEDYVLSKDIMYVGGGNTRNMLVLWKEWGLDAILKKAWEQGIILAGLSAGSICWFEEGVTDSIPGELTGLTCLGFLPGSNCPHYDGEQEMRPSYHRLMQEGKVGHGIAVDDGVGIHYLDRNIHRVISSRPHARAYCVESGNGVITENGLVPVFLGES